MGEIDKETYHLTFEHLNNQALAIGKELNNEKTKISNLEDLLEKSLQRLENLSTTWLQSNLEEKRRMHKTLFPEGIFYDPKNRQYLTRNMNRYVQLVSTLSMNYTDKKNRILQSDDEKSCFVANEGKISNQLIEDLIAVSY